MKILIIFFAFSLINYSRGDCPDGFDQVNSKCIHITPQRSTHHKAELTCKTLNAHLVYIQNAIVGLCRTVEKCRLIKDNASILSYSSNITSPMWIGATCKVNKQPKECRWDDGSNVDYSNFLPGYPVTNIGTCVYLDSQNQPLKGRWISATCDLDEYHAICEAY